MLGRRIKICGIAFTVNYNSKKKIDLAPSLAMFKDLSFRGKEASGYYFERYEKDSLIKMLVKSPCQSDKLIEHTNIDIISTNAKEKKIHKKGKLTGKERLILFHTRQSTVGDPKFIDNNHPIFSENYVLIHNGMINNVNIPKYEYRGVVDSEEILAYIETHGLLGGLKRLHGTMAIIFKKFNSDSLFVYRDFNPLHLKYYPKEKILMGCSSEFYFPDSSDNEDVVFSERVFLTENPSIEVPSGNLYSISLLKPEITFIGTCETIKKPTLSYPNRDANYWHWELIDNRWEKIPGPRID